MDVASGNDALGGFLGQEGGPHYDVVVVDCRARDHGVVLGMVPDAVHAKWGHRNVVMMATRSQRKGLPLALDQSFLPELVTRGRLLYSLQTALGIATAPAKVQKKIVIQQASAAKILVAEDDQVQQALLRSQLTKQLGYQDGNIVFVERGDLVADQLARTRFDLVIMDGHLKDGSSLPVCEQVRSRWTDLSIIAVTAEAMKGDKERYLTAGFSAYLQKPTSLEILEQAILTHLPKSGGTETRAVVDFDKILTAVEGDRDFAAEIITIYLEQSSKQVEGIDQAIQTNHANGDRTSLQEIAHALKAPSNQFGATRLGDLCQRLENLGRQGNTDGADEIFKLLQAEWKRVEQALQDFVGNG